jgi:hypothetical protein
VLNKKSLEGIIKAGALDQFHDRKVLGENIEVILDWVKTSANADQGLFGGMETKITLKKADTSTLMERLMMEQDVFKAFVSGNPLDGLYKYIKKHTLISQIKDKAEIQHFETICYIKEIQRARKRGFFIKVEDVTETFEFFVTDPCGLEKFDVLVIQGFKRNNRVQVTKIIKTSHDRLKELAGSTYDENDTVANVKKARYGEQKQAEITRLKEESIKSKDANAKSPENTTYQNTRKGSRDFEGLEMEIEEDTSLDEVVEKEANLENEAIIEDEEVVVNHETGDVVPICDCEETTPKETVSSTESEALGESEGDMEDTTNSLLERAKDLMNEIVDPTLPLVIDSSLLKTIEDVRSVAELIKNNPGERKANILGKEVQISDSAVEVLKEKFKV